MHAERSALESFQKRRRVGVNPPRGLETKDCIAGGFDVDIARWVRRIGHDCISWDAWDEQHPDAVYVQPALYVRGSSHASPSPA